MDIIAVPEVSESWLNNASHWKAPITRNPYRSFTEPTDILERLRILAAVCRWQGQTEQSEDFLREYKLLEAKLNNSSQPK